MYSLFFIDEKTSKRERGKNWGEEETFGFIDVWAENYQELAKPGTRNTPIYKRMAMELNQSLSPRHFTGLSVKRKIGNLVGDYTRRKKGQLKTGASPCVWPYFDVLDKLIGR